MTTPATQACPPTPLDDDARSRSRARRQARNLHHLHSLYTEREELRGVSPVADMFADAVAWSA